MCAHLSISILETEKHKSPLSAVKDEFILYLIETKLLNEINGGDTISKSPGVYYVSRRYSEFDIFRNYLIRKYPALVIAPLPEKMQLYPWRAPFSDNFETDFVDRRRACLENFLHRIAFHPILRSDPIFHKFLMQEKCWDEEITQEDYLDLFESKLKKMPVISTAFCKEFENLYSYAKQLEVNVDAVLKLRAKVTDKEFLVDALHTNFGSVFNEWSTVEKNIENELKKVGNLVGSVGTSVEVSLQEEDVIFDQLKEYLFYASSVQTVYNHYMQLQFQLQQFDVCIDGRKAEIENLEKGRTVMSRLFGAQELKETRDSKIVNVKIAIELDEKQKAEKEIELQKFKEVALSEYNDFSKQKDEDIRDSLRSYIANQIISAKRNLGTWKNIKNCLENIS